MGLIIDTSAIVELERKKKSFIAKLDRYKDEPVALPAIVWAELLAGVRLAKDPAMAARRRAQLEQLKSCIQLIEFDSEIAEVYADIFTECHRRGKMIPQNDIAVAATARSLDYGILVGAKGENHFRQIKGLKIVKI